MVGRVILLAHILGSQNWDLRLQKTNASDNGKEELETEVYIFDGATTSNSLLPTWWKAPPALISKFRANRNIIANSIIFTFKQVYTKLNCEESLK